MISIVKYNRGMDGEHNFIETDVELSTKDVAAISSELYQDLISYIDTDNMNNILCQKNLIK